MLLSDIDNLGDKDEECSSDWLVKKDPDCPHPDTYQHAAYVSIQFEPKMGAFCYE